MGCGCRLVSLFGTTSSSSLTRYTSAAPPNFYFLGSLAISRRRTRGAVFTRSPTSGGPSVLIGFCPNTTGLFKPDRSTGTPRARLLGRRPSSCGLTGTGRRFRRRSALRTLHLARVISPSSTCSVVIRGRCQLVGFPT